MLYIGALILISISAGALLNKILKHRLLSKKRECAHLNDEHEKFSLENARLNSDNLRLEDSVAQTIALYDITKQLCKSLDEEKIFTIFNEQLKNHIEISSCQFLTKDADLTQCKGCTVLPLAIQQDKVGYLIAKGIPDKDKDRFQILGQQFLIGIKRALLYKKVQELSITDSLTQLFSRRHFLDRLKEELRRSRKFKLCFSFFMIDIDKFKNCNDKYGHLVGDAILREVSKTIKESLRQIDFVGRYGGEELAVVLAETNKQQALFVAERLRHEIELKRIKVYDEELKVTISIGVATFSGDGEDTTEIIEAADKALYMAKQAGRNKVCAHKAR